MHNHLLNLQQLQYSFAQLCELKQRIDTANILSDAPFVDMKAALMRLADNPIYTENQTIWANNQIEYLADYLRQFEQFIALLSQFQRAAMGYTWSKVQSATAYSAAQVLVVQMYQAFTTGVAFLSDSIAAQLIALGKELQKIREELRQTPASSPNTDPKLSALSLFLAPNLTVTALLGQTQLPNPQLEQQFAISTICEVKRGYRYWKLQEITALLNDQVSPYTAQLNKLSAALRTHAPDQLSAALADFADALQPIVLQQPANYTITTQPILALEGTAEPVTKIVVQLNDQLPFEILTDIKGNFKSLDLQLTYGKNTVVLYYRDFVFAHQIKMHYYIMLARNYPFVDQFEPFAKCYPKADDAHSLLQCKVCKHYMYNFSIAENQQSCIFSPCTSTEFWGCFDPEFWQLAAKV